MVSVGREQDRHYVAWLLGLGVLLLGLAGVFNWVVDPLYFYHRPWFDIGFSKNQRLQNPGIARQFDYDAVLLGTSRTETFQTSALQRALGLNIINLSVSASLVTEQALLLDVVLQNQAIRRVVWEINYPSFSLGDRLYDRQGDRILSLGLGTFPEYLYEVGPETPFRYLLSLDILFESLRAIRGQRPDNYDTLHYWVDRFEYSEARVLAAWDHRRRYWTDARRAYLAQHAPTPREVQDVFVKRVERVIQQNPQVQFDLLLLPATVLEYGMDFRIRRGRFESRLSLNEAVARAQAQFPNVRIFNFQVDKRLTHDFSRWKDLEHFDASTNEFIINALAQDGYQATSYQLLCATEELRRQVLTYMDEFCTTEGNDCPAPVRQNMHHVAAQPRPAPSCPDD